MAVMIMNDYYVIQYLRKVSLGGEGGAASCSGICARVGGAAAVLVSSAREWEELPPAV